MGVWPTRAAGRAKQEKRRKRVGAIAASAFLLTTASAFAQGGAAQRYSAAEVNAGAKLYRTHCVSCHGAGGDQIPAVNLSGIGPALSNDAIVDVILNGSANGAMSGFPDISKTESLHIVAYLRSGALGAAPTRPADNAALSRVTNAVTPLSETAVRGKMVFEKSDCLTCHRVGNGGAYSGPDLSDIAFVRSREELVRSLLEPDAEVVPHNRSYRVVTLEGVTVSGRLLNHDTFRVQLVDSVGRLLSFEKANLRTFSLVMKSPMPSYRDRLSAEELADLVAYLATLKK